MTGYTVNTGSTTKFSENWDRIFAGQSARSTTAKSSAKAAKAPAKAKPADKKATGKKTPRQ